MFLAIFFALLGSAGALLGAALLLAFPDPVRNRLLPCLVAYATGTLLGAAFLGSALGTAGFAYMISQAAVGGHAGSSAAMVFRVP